MRLDAHENREESPRFGKLGGLSLLFAILFLVVSGGCDISPVPTPIPGDEDYEEGGFGVSSMPEEEGEFSGSIGSSYEEPMVSDDERMEVDRVPGEEDGEPPNSGVGGGESGEAGAESGDLEEGGAESVDEEELGGDSGGDESAGDESGESGGEGEGDEEGAGEEAYEDVVGGDSDIDEPNDVCGPENDEEDADSFFDEPDAGSIENGADAGGC